MTFRLFLLFPTMCLLNPAVTNGASGGRIALYSDSGLSECALTDTGPGIADIYVVHSIQGSPTAALGASGIAFALVPSPGFNGIWLEDIVPGGLFANGTSLSGTNIASLTCWFSDKLVLHVRYQVEGSSSSCSYLEAVSPPGYPWVYALTCGYGEPVVVDGSRIFVNPDSSCPCELTVGTESTTWGRIKNLYRN